MYSRSKILQKLRIIGTNHCKCKNSTDTKSKRVYSVDFFKNEVQKLLRDITDVDPEIVFRKRCNNRFFRVSTLEFMTADQLEAEKKTVERKSNWLLQIPPLITPVGDKLEVLEENPSLDGHDFEHSKIVFTDISEGYSNEERIIVVREPNGMLRKAMRNERHRMNQIFFPLPGRDFEMPKLFEKELLQDLIDREEYLYILDRACIQFDPDDEMYHNVIEPTYETINNKFHFEKLRSTRHFGSLAFYLVNHKKVDNLLIYMLRKERLDHALSLIFLYHIVHPDCKSAKLGKVSDEDLLKVFIESNVNKKEDVNIEWQNYLRKVKEKAEMEKQIREAHGV